MFFTFRVIICANGKTNKEIPPTSQVIPEPKSSLGRIQLIHNFHSIFPATMPLSSRFHNPKNEVEFINLKGKYSRQTSFLLNPSPNLHCKHVPTLSLPVPSYSRSSRTPLAHSVAIIKHQLCPQNMCHMPPLPLPTTFPGTSHLAILALSFFSRRKKVEWIVSKVSSLSLSFFQKNNAYVSKVHLDYLSNTNEKMLETSNMFTY